MAELLPALAGRFACRHFTVQPVAANQLASILEAGRIAPSGFGMEPWRFVVATSDAARPMVATACFSQPPVVTAPLLIALVALADALGPNSDFVQARLRAEAGDPPSEELKQAWRGFCEHTNLREWAIAQCNFAAMQMMVQATALGLASCPIGGFDQTALARVLDLAAGEVPALVLAIGHCADRQGERRRRGMDEMLTVIN
jgi:nitroreductase